MDPVESKMTLRVALTEQKLSTGARLFRNGLEVAGEIAIVHKDKGRYTNQASNASLLTQIWSLNKPASDDFAEAILLAVDARTKNEPPASREIIRRNIVTALSNQRIAYLMQRTREAEMEPTLADTVAAATRLWIYRGRIDGPGRIAAVGQLPLGRFPVSVNTDSRTGAIAFWAHFIARLSQKSGPEDGVRAAEALSNSENISVFVDEFSHPVSVILIDAHGTRLAYDCDFDIQPLAGSRLCASLAQAWERRMLDDTAASTSQATESGPVRLPLKEVLQESLAVANLLRMN